MSSNTWALVGVLTTAALVAVITSYRSTPAAATVLGVGTLILGVLAGIDIATHRLPNPIVAALALYALAVVAVAGLTNGDIGRTVSAVSVGLAFVGVGAALAFTGLMGMGDAKLGFPIGVAAGWFGPLAVLITIAVSAATGALGGLVVMATRGRKSEISYGPFLAVGSVVGVIASSN